ncbi:MAG TPA: hypothetical protein VM695_07955, partial [Phycisphaerae bacterium]|nr:hypothetical protein [Phycisphaerae bacterium]
VTGGDFGGEVYADAGIGKVSVTAGHFNAALIAPNGMVGGIKVTSQVQFNPQAGQPEPMVLGGDVNGYIFAGQVGGKSVGPISASGGAVGAGGMLGIQAAGSVGKISSTALSKGFWMTNELGERTLMMAQREGGVMLNLFSEGGKLAGISIVGGVLGGTIQADAGIGPITVKQGDVVVDLLEAANGPIAGITVTGQAVKPMGAPDGEVMVVGGNLSATVRSGQARGKAVGNITVTGGLVGLIIEAVGNVGNITNKGLKYSTREPDENDRMRSVPQYQMSGLSCTVTSEQGNVGKIAVTGGEVMAMVRALNGTAAGIAGTGVMVSEMGMGSMCLGGSVFADVEAASIGTVNSLGGFVTGTLNAVKISGVSAKVITVGAKVQRWSEWGETFYETTPGMYFGGGIMGLMIQCVGANASVGAISSVGGPVEVFGEVSTPLGRIKVTSKPVRYLADYQENENGRLVAVYETIGGLDMVSNGLSNPPGFP